MATIHDSTSAVGSRASVADGGPRAEIGSSAASVTTIEDEVHRLEQALLDLDYCRTTSVALTHCPSARREKDLARQLAQAARGRGFVTAHLSMAETPLDTLQELVSLLIDALVPPGDSKARGLLYLLDVYFERYGNRSHDRWVEAVEEEGAWGDLAAFCAAYVSATDDARREVQALTLWAAGQELRRQQLIPGVRSTLNAHTAQRVFGDLTRILRALGYRGLFVLLSEGHEMARRTDRQREKGYTVLRELVDNFDSCRGAVSARIHLTGGDALFVGPRSLRTLSPLLMRLELPSEAEPPPPHRTWTSLIREPYEYVHRRVRSPEGVKPAALRSFIRVAQGLPPTEGLASMSVGHERIDRQISQLFHHAENAGSVFQVLSGEYGSGKTHLLLHLADRALHQGHPVFWLNLERMNLDLGNPARHLARVLQQSVMPRRGRPSAQDRAVAWTRSRARLGALRRALEDIAEAGAEEAGAAKKALSAMAQAEEGAGQALEAFLAARDLTRKSSGANYRQDAYRRFLLWAELLRRMDGAKGPVLLIDEAENLYTSGVPRPGRRSALRTLAFYCGGTVPEACVVLAMTPVAFKEMRKESGGLLREQSEVESTLPLEDVLLFRRRLAKLVPAQVPAFSRPMRNLLADRVRATHQAVRGPVEIEDWEEIVRSAVAEGGPPRTLVRNLSDQLEAAWWAGY